MTVEGVGGGIITAVGDGICGGVGICGVGVGMVVVVVGNGVLVVVACDVMEVTVAVGMMRRWGYENGLSSGGSGARLKAGADSGWTGCACDGNAVGVLSISGGSDRLRKVEGAETGGVEKCETSLDGSDEGEVETGGVVEP